MTDIQKFYNKIRRRYGEVAPEALEAVLAPVTLPIYEIDKEIFKVKGQTHWRATFKVEVHNDYSELLYRGMTGKFVPKSYVAEGGIWREICKGRIIDFDVDDNFALGEIYVGNNKGALEIALKELSKEDFLEVDQYGAAAKVLSSLTEYYLAKHAVNRGYSVKRMPEDTAKHIGAYYNYDFEFMKNGLVRKIEAKSLWGTNTDYARLIHSTTTKPKGSEETWTPYQIRNYYPTSSCKFSTQDIFAVNLFLRTGNIKDFAFARSLSITDDSNGLPFASKYPNHVNQNPKCIIDNKIWFSTIDEVWF